MKLSPERAVAYFRRRFAAEGAPDRARGAQAYMESDLDFHGVTQAQLRAAAADFCKENRHLDRDGLRAIVGALFATTAFDLRSVGAALLERKEKLLTMDDAAWLVDLAR